MDVPPIAAIIEHYGGRLRRDYGSWQKIKCPFHDDSHASAGVSVTDNIFVCHGC
jgi:DNA primase